MKSIQKHEELVMSLLAFNLVVKFFQKLKKISMGLNIKVMEFVRISM
jgi:hypothetical protein